MTRFCWISLLLLLAGCPTPMVYQPTARMLERYPAPEARRRLAALLESSVVPRLERVEVAADRVRYLRDGVLPVELRLREILRIDIYPNDKLFLYAADGRELAWFLLPRRIDCTRMADLLVSLRDAAP